MKALVRGVVIPGVLLVGMFGMPTPAPASGPLTFDPAPGEVLAPLGGQVVSLAPDGSPPRRLTRLSGEAPALEVAALPGARTAAVVTVSPFEGSGPLGGDLGTVDRTTGEVTPLVTRGSGDESLAAPVWAADGSLLAFERADKSGVAVAFPGQADARYPTRVDVVRADGGGRSTVVEDGHQPALSPTGAEVAFLRSEFAGTGLYARAVAGGPERLLLPPERFADLASPRYSPQGDRIAFMAAGEPRGDSPLGSFLGPAVAHAHGIPWDLWTIAPDGTNPQRLAALGADDATLSWSPDGSQVFVYGSTGSSLIQVATGQVASLPRVQGQGAPAWVLSLS